MSTGNAAGGGITPAAAGTLGMTAREKAIEPEGFDVNSYDTAGPEQD